MSAELGKLVAGIGVKDAVHVALAPMVAAVDLAPGEHVGIKDGRATTAAIHIGIVDPFLRDRVQAGSRFWLCLYPNTVTDMRHEWEHPSFVGGIPVGSESERWIRSYAATVPLDYEVLMDGADEYVRSKKEDEWGEYLCFGGLLEGKRVPNEFWPHYEAVRGVEVEEDHRGSFFSCSCRRFPWSRSARSFGG